jgi:hypothetical protein
VQPFDIEEVTQTDIARFADRLLPARRMDVAVDGRDIVFGHSRNRPDLAWRKAAVMPRLLSLSAVILAATCGQAAARIPSVSYLALDEVPVARLLANLERREAPLLSPAEKARAIGRIHLLAYARQTDHLTVYRNAPTTVFEGSDATVPCPPQEGGPSGRCLIRGSSGSARQPRETPEPADAGREKTPHLNMALAAYGRARRLEPQNPRTRLALAYLLDEDGRREEARAELRFILRQGLAEPPAALMPWQGDPTAYIEAVEHLRAIAAKRTDRKLASAMARRLPPWPTMEWATPILVPLEPASFEDLIDHGSRVAFDFGGQRTLLRAGWLNSNAAWLVWDPNDRRKITNGSQLFGSVTWHAFWDDGYKALATLDDDGDGEVAGIELAGLALWRDSDRDGVSARHEVRPVAEMGVVALRYRRRRVDPEHWTAAEGVTFADGRTWATYDWIVGPGARRRSPR